VRVISLHLLRAFQAQHPDAGEPLRQWCRTVTRAEWATPQDALMDYPNAVGVRTKWSGTLTVFTIGDAAYRLIARIRFDCQLVNVCRVLTQAEYDLAAWKESPDAREEEPRG
jgi:mRNA-degrading endonuclease HigB of HigAB toxin-antitoxin module